MAVDLPPPIPPQEASVARTRQGEAVATVAFQDHRIHVFGAPVLTEGELAVAIRAAPDLSGAVRAIAAASYAAGYPAAHVAYARAGQDVYVLITLDGVSRVDGPAPLARYFAGVVGDTPLTAAALEPRRALASIHADRAGLDATPVLVPGGSAGAAMDLKPSDGGPDPNQVRVEFGNPGNRFAGRYFLDVDLRYSTRWGDELRALTREGLRGRNDPPRDGEYFEQNLGWNRVTPLGIFGLGGRYLDYNFRTAPPDTVDGILWVGEAYWLYPVLADFDSRLTTQLKVDRTSKTTEQSTGGPVGLQPGDDVQRELYNSAEISASYLRSEELGGRWDLELGGAVRKGLGEHAASGRSRIDQPLTRANLDYLLYRASLGAKYHFADTVTLGLSAHAQFTSDTVPEQQQWVMGGLNHLATALPGVAVGDRGYLGRLVLEAGEWRLLGVTLRPKAFAEYGATRLAAGTGGARTPTLADAGAEIAVTVLPWLEGSAVWAEKIFDDDFDPAQLDAADANLYFKVQAKF